MPGAHCAKGAESAEPEGCAGGRAVFGLRHKWRMSEKVAFLPFATLRSKTDFFGKGAGGANGGWRLAVLARRRPRPARATFAHEMKNS